MVRQWQEFSTATVIRIPHGCIAGLRKLAEAYGHVGILVEKPSDVESALKEAFARKDDLVFLDLRTDSTENVYPMVPGGKGFPK